MFSSQPEKCLQGIFREQGVLIETRDAGGDASVGARTLC